MSMPPTPLPASPPSPPSPPVLTIREVAAELRCSKAHVHNIIAGKVHDLPPLPVLRIGRRRLVRAEGLKRWMADLEAREIEAQRLTGCFR
ncbi:helix-turn-helix domain-containing protein [Paludibaculum fermentans]|uniref:helix-turn-helix domain-containing protein n=1 Tax=Paludibaculum fermentans TaxID=1473598 RepID=UPI003EB77AC9